MRNERNAGRKPKLSGEELKELYRRWKAGESGSLLAAEAGISRQALYKHFREMEYKPVRIDYITGDELVTVIEADFRKEELRIVNYAKELSRLAFGYEQSPRWEEFLSFLENHFLDAAGVDGKDTFLLCENNRSFSLDDICKNNGEYKLIVKNENEDDVPVFRIQKQDLILLRSDTDGYQMKALVADRRLFVKAQAVIGGTPMRDWAVEIIASGICRQLGIVSLEQKHCRIVYAGRMLDGVFSPNFEMDGNTFISFESLLERNNRSSNDAEYIRLGAVDKLKWCAKQLAEIGNIAYDKAEKYMLDLAVLDCLVGNIDRHTRNFGLFYNCDTGEFSIPPVFDSGMGLFEHDYYRDRYESYEAAMNNVYVSPYGEDPFDMLTILDKEFGLKKIYPGIDEPEYGDLIDTPFAVEYMERMKTAWQKLG